MATFAELHENSRVLRANSYHKSLELDESMDSGVDISDAFEYGLPAAIVSGVVGTLNTGVAFANALGADFDNVSTEEILGDWGWEETSAYYLNHQSTIDAVGFGISAIVPGVLGFKAAHLAQKGLQASKSTSRLVTGLKKALVPEARGIQFLRATHTETASFSRFTLGRKAAAQGFHQNFVESAFAETAILLTNAKNPSISRADQTYGEAVMNNLGGLAFGTILGTGIGGTISAISHYAKLKHVFAKDALETNMLSAGIKLDEFGFPIGGNTGDNIASQWQQLETIKTNLVKAAEDLTVNMSKSDMKQLADSIKLQQSFINTNIARLTGEVDKAGKIADNAPLAGQIIKALKDADAHSAIAIFANLKRISRHHDGDLIMNPTVSPLEVLTDAEYDARYVELGGTVKGAKGSLGAQFNNMEQYGTGGVAERAKAILVRKSIMEDPKAKAEDIMFIMRHEFGHDQGNRLESAFFSDNAKVIREQAETLSKVARGTHWIQRENELASATVGLARQMQIGNKTSKEAAGARLQRAEADMAYMQSPRELLADSWAMFNRSDKDMIAFKKIAPDLYKVMANNSAIKLMLGETESAMDLKTLDMFMVPDRNPTVADMGGVKFTGNSGKVTYANGVINTNFGRNTNVKAKRLNVLETTNPEEASAYYYAASVSKNLIKPDNVIPWTDFPTLHALMKRSEAGELRHTYTIEMPNGTTSNFSFGGSELLGTKAEDQIAEFAQQFKAFKMEAIQRIRNTSVDGKLSGLTESDIARITDTHERFVQYGGHAQKNNDGSAIAFWSKEYDVNKPTMVRMKYKVKSELANKNLAEDISTIEQRHTMNLRSAHSAAIAFTSKVAQGITNAMPTPSFAAGVNIAQDVVESTAIRGTVGSVAGQYGKVESFIQSVANFNELFKKKFYGAIDDVTGSAALILKNDNLGLQEAAVLDGILRRDFYKFAPISKDNLESELTAFLTSFQTKPEFAERIPVIMNLILAPLKQKAESGTLLWTRQLESTIASAMHSKQFGDTTLNKITSQVETGVQVIRSKNLANFWKAKTSANAMIVEGKKTVAGIRGLSSSLDGSVLYPGAFDIKKFKHIKFVHPTRNGVFTDNKAGIIASTTPEGLITKEAQVRDALGKDITISSQEELLESKTFGGIYSQELAFDENAIDSMMQRKGVMWDLVPEPSPDIIDHYIADMKGQAKGVADSLTASSYADEFAALEYQSDRIQLRDTTGGKSPIKDPNREAIDVMLNNSGSTPSFWKTAQQDADKLVSKAMNTVTHMFKASKTQGDYQQMNKYMEEAGLPSIYGKQVGKFLNENEKISEQILAEVIPAANGAAATMMLRLDLIQPLVTALSTPITAIPEIKHLIDSIPDLVKQQALRDSLRVTVPRGDAVVADAVSHSMPSNMKLMMQATKDYWQKPELVKKYAELGLTPSIVQEMREQAERVALNPEVLKQGGGKQQFLGHIKELVNILAKPADFMEGFVKFQAARMADITLTAAGITDDAIKIAAMNTYVKRVHGNYSYAQRPAMFQGFAGQAIGLFQTYQFNMIQQFMRHIGDKNVGAANAMIGLQAGIFGVQSLPGFQAMNQHIGERSKEGRDFYTGTNDILGNEASEWLLYGMGSNFTKPIMSAANYLGVMDTQSQGLTLFTRGDLTPRTPILLPTSIEDLPVINLTTKFVLNVLDTADAFASGVPVSQVFADALAQNGINRPLSGIGQMLGGAKVTSKGGLIAAQQDLDWWQGLAKLAGTSTLDEGVASQHYYRAKGYDTYRREQINNIGVRTKEMIRSGAWDGDVYQDTFERYAELGGKSDYYEKWVHDQYMGATESQITKMRSRHDSPSGKYMQRLMGATISPSVQHRFVVEPQTPDPLGAEGDKDFF